MGSRGTQRLPLYLKNARNMIKHKFSSSSSIYRIVINTSNVPFSAALTVFRNVYKLHSLHSNFAHVYQPIRATGRVMFAQRISSPRFYVRKFGHNYDASASDQQPGEIARARVMQRFLNHHGLTAIFSCFRVLPASH